MRILHTSDWHIGRTFFGEDVSAQLREALLALVAAAREHEVDAVVVAGDVFDSTMPSAAAFDFLTDILVALHETGARVVLTSGNHDSASRLRFQSRWARASGIHVIADPESAFGAVELRDEHGPVRVYGVPYLEPALIRHVEGAPASRTQEAAMRWAADLARADLDASGSPRSLLIAHCFAAGVPASADAQDIERDLTAGGLDVVPVEVFDGFDYVALGHIHGRATLRDRVRYSGSPLHYSFSEAGSPRGAWLVELDAHGFAGAEWLPLPVPRPLVRLRDSLRALLEAPDYEAVREHWVAATLTDERRPVDAMSRLRTRFPRAVHVEHAPAERRGREHGGYAATLAKAPTDAERIERFLEHTRNGQGPTEAERRILEEALDEYAAQEASR